MALTVLSLFGYAMLFVLPHFFFYASFAPALGCVKTYFV